MAAPDVNFNELIAKLMKAVVSGGRRILNWETKDDLFKFDFKLGQRTSDFHVPDKDVKIQYKYESNETRSTGQLYQFDFKKYKYYHAFDGKGVITRQFGNRIDDDITPGFLAKALDSEFFNHVNDRHLHNDKEEYRYRSKLINWKFNTITAERRRMIYAQLPGRVVE